MRARARFSARVPGGMSLWGLLLVPGGLMFLGSSRKARRPGRVLLVFLLPPTP